MTVIITTGAHGHNVHIPRATIEPYQFAHQWDNDEIEDTAHQASNFIRYAEAVGGYVGPVILLMGPKPTDPALAALLNVNCADWADIVGSALKVEVEIR